MLSSYIKYFDFNNSPVNVWYNDSKECFILNTKQEWWTTLAQFIVKYPLAIGVIIKSYNVGNKYYKL